MSRRLGELSGRPTQLADGIGNDIPDEKRIDIAQLSNENKKETPSQWQQKVAVSNTTKMKLPC